MSAGPIPTISVIIPCFNEAQVFPHLRQEISRLADALRQDYSVEIIFIDDGSRDATWDAIASFAAADPRVRGARLSRNFGHQFALTCGYDLTTGDAVVSMDADLQDPPEVAIEMISEWRKGYDIVLAVRRRRLGESLFKRGTAALFYRLMSVLGAREIRSSAGDFRLMSRPALDALSKMREPHRFVRGMVGWIGFRTTEVYFDRPPRAAGDTRYPFRKMLRLAADAAISFSSAPLRAAYWAAVALLLINLGYLTYVLVQSVFFNVELVKGWTSLLLAVISFGTMNLVCLGLIGEYLGRVYEQGKHRPLYLIRDEAGAVTPRRTAHGSAKS